MVDRQTTFEYSSKSERIYVLALYVYAIGVCVAKDLQGMGVGRGGVAGSGRAVLRFGSFPFIKEQVFSGSIGRGRAFLSMCFRNVVSVSIERFVKIK